MIRPLLILALLLAATLVKAQWVSGGIFSTVDHFQACAFQDADSGLFVYGANNPGPGSFSNEGGVIRTENGDLGGGYYVWYEPDMNIEDIDVKVVDGFPYYLAAGHQDYGTSVILKQIMGGSTFFFDSVRTGFSRYYHAVRMRSDLVAFAAGGDYLGNGIIDMSTDTGATWANVSVLSGQPVSRLHFVNDALGFASTGGYRRLYNNGVFLPDSGAIYRTTNGGLDWSQVFADTVTGFSDVAFSSALNGVATRNDGAILRTTDGGDTWAPAEVDVADSVVMTSVTFRQDGAAFAAGYRMDGLGAFILMSDDDGATWYENFNTNGLNAGRRLYDLYFFDEAHGYACGHIRTFRTDGIAMDVQGIRAQGLELFPNPTDDQVTVRLASGAGALVEIMDAAGRMLGTLRVNGPTGSIDVRALLPGAYLLRAISNGTVFYARLVRS